MAALAASADAPSAFLQMLAAKGVLQEAGVLRDAFAARGLRIADLSSARSASVPRADVIYQAPMTHGDFFGIADFLVRVPDAQSVRAATHSWLSNGHTLCSAPLSASCVCAAFR